MMVFLEENWGNILVLAGVAAVAAAAAWRLVKDRKAGRSGCGCGCSCCPSRGACRSPDGGKSPGPVKQGVFKEEEIFTLKNRR